VAVVAPAVLGATVPKLTPTRAPVSESWMVTQAGGNTGLGDNLDVGPSSTSTRFPTELHSFI
jgi:hypothetical protein